MHKSFFKINKHLGWQQNWMENSEFSYIFSPHTYTSSSTTNPILFFSSFIYFLAVLGLCCCMGYSAAAVRRLLSLQWLLLLTSQALGLWSHSVIAAPKLESTGLVVVAHGLICSRAWGIFLDQESNCVSCIGRWILYHWATGEAPNPLLDIPTRGCICDHWWTYSVASLSLKVHSLH